MTQVVVLGAGYAGVGAVTALERELDDDVALTWISDDDRHLVRHEVHRAIRDPSVEAAITIPVESIKNPSTAFVEGRVTAVDTDARRIELADGSDVEYDYLLVALGSATAFYGIPGLEEYAHTLKDLDDATAIHGAVRDGAAAATPDDPLQVVVGGGGLSGIQAAGEIAEYRDEHGAPIDISLVEALEEILPGQDPQLQSRVRRYLEKRGIEVLTDDPITEAEAERIRFDERDPLPYDVFVWAGGITGQDALEGAAVEANHNRVIADATFGTSDERVFAVGDSAAIEIDGDPVPPTAQAAWDAAEVAAENVARATAGRSLRTWSYTDRGTVLSIGDDAVAHDVQFSPIRTFGSAPARFLKKFIAARWIATAASWKRALSSWDAL